jgi:hypothetical protein
MDLVVLWLCCLFFRADLAGRGLAASIWLGGAIAMKLTPTVFVVNLVGRRLYRRVVLTLGWVIVWAVGLPALASNRELALYGTWIRALRARLDAPATLEHSHFTLAAALTHLWPAAIGIPGLRYWTAALILTPILVIEWRGPLVPRGQLMLFAMGLVAIPLISPISETHHLTLLAGPLWLWMLAAGTPPLRTLELAGVLLFLVAHWLALAVAGPGGSRAWSIFDVVALTVLYLVLLARTLGGCPSGSR